MTLDALLSLYAGSTGSRNALLICTRISTFAPGEGPDRLRLYHSEEVAYPFVSWRGRWWWGDEAVNDWNPLTGPAAEAPSLEYMDTGAVYIPAETDYKVAPGKFAAWSMTPNPDFKGFADFSVLCQGDFLAPSADFRA